MGYAAQVSGIAHLVGVQRAVQNSDNMKSEPQYLACKEFELFLVFLSLSWLLQCADLFFFVLFCFLSQSCQLSTAFSAHLCTWLRKVHTLWRASHTVFLILHDQSPRNVQTLPCNPDILPGCEHKLTFWAWPQIGIPKCYRKLTFLNNTANWYS